MSEAAAPPLDILFQDDWLVAVDKPAGQMIHPADHPQEGDQVTMKILRDQLNQHIHTIHRLDRPTCGVVLFATDSEVAKALQRAFENREVTKTYLAVIEGQAPEEEWICELALRKSKDAVERSACTHFKRLAEYAADSTLTLSLIQAIPESGRYHQIRKHLQHAGTPIVGDYRYAGIERSSALSEQLNLSERMLLQAQVLEFSHPKTGESVRIAAPDEPLITQWF